MIYSRHTSHYLQKAHFDLQSCIEARINTFLVVSTEQTRLSPHWPWGSFVKTKSHPPYSPLRTGLIHTYIHVFSSHILWCCSCTSVTFCCHHIISSPLFFRYIYYFGGLLSGTIKMNSSPLFLHQILIPSLPNFQAGGGQFYTNLCWNNSLRCLIVIL